MALRHKQAGYDAATSWEAEDSNPHKFGSKEHFDWLKGFRRGVGERGPVNTVKTPKPKRR